LLKFGGAFQYAHMEQTTREPYCGNGEELANFYRTGEWTSGNKYMTSGFSESRMFQQSYNLYARSVYALEDLPYGFRNTFLVQPDFYYREGSNSFGVPTDRYGVTLQDSVGWGWVTLLGGIRYDYFYEHANDQTVTNAKTGAKTTTHYDEADGFDKPFLLPQKSPDFNNLRLKSYNIPEFISGDASGKQAKIKTLFD